MCVDREYSTLSCKCENVGECFACLLVLSRKRHTKNTGGKKVQFNDLFYYQSLGKPSARFPHQISNTRKHLTNSQSELYRNCITEIYRQQPFGKLLWYIQNTDQYITHNTKIYIYTSSK